MNVLLKITEKLKDEKIHMTLIDPASQGPEQSAAIAEQASSAGTDFIMVGGSSNISSRSIDHAIISIKERTSIPVIIFPGSPEMISPHADAIYFMSLLNSRSIEFVIGHHVNAAPFIHDLGVETIPMGYIVFEPGMTVGRVGNVDLIGRTDSVRAGAYALAAQMLGMKLVYFESGSGSPTHVDSGVVRNVKKKLDIPLIVGGGIRTPEVAADLCHAGADIIVTGTVVEKSSDIPYELKRIVSAVKQH